MQVFLQKVIYFVSEAKCGSTWAAKWTIACFKQGQGLKALETIGL